MALTIVPDLTLVCDGTTGQDPFWTGEDGVSTEVFQQGTGSQSWLVTKNAIETAVYDYYTANSNTVADTSAANTHLYLHIRCDIAPFIDYFNVRLTDGSANWSEWILIDNTGVTEWYGEWKTFVIDLDSTPDTSSGTLIRTQIHTFSFTVDNRNSGNIRSIENTYIDVVRFGTGLTAYDDVGTVFDFTDIETIANNPTNKYGVIEKIGGIFFVKGRITIGTTDVANRTAKCTTNNEVLVFVDPSVSGESFSAGFHGISTAGTKDGVTEFQCGTKVGTGDAMTGRDGTTLMGESPSTLVTFDFPDTTSMNLLQLYGSLFRYTGGEIDLAGMGEVGGCTFDGCGMIWPGETGVFRNLTFINSVSAVTAGAVRWEPATDLEYASFINNPNGIFIETSVPAGDYTAVGLEFSGNTYGIRYVHINDRNWNWSEASAAPSIDNVTTGTLTAVNTVNLDIDGTLSGARIFIVALAGGDLSVGTEIANELATGTSWSDTFAFTNNQPVTVRVRSSSVPGSEKIPWELDTSITSAGLDLIAQLIDDT